MPGLSVQEHFVKNGVVIRHFGIVVSNMERSLVFYRDILGLHVWNVSDGEGNYIDTILGLRDAKVHMVKLHSGGALIELLEFFSPAGERPENPRIYCVGPTHVAFTVRNLEKLVGSMKKEGIRFVSEPQISPDGKAKVVFCLDPDGNYVELVEELVPLHSLPRPETIP